MATQLVEGEVVAGPGKFDVMLALFIGAKAMFTIRLPLPGLGTLAPTSIIARIDGLTAEDGSLESWLVKGYLDPDKKDGFPRPFEGWYSTTIRRGHFKITEVTE